MTRDRIIPIGGRRVGSGHPVYIVFEAGPTHDGVETAKKLVDVAVEAGADAIKFQILNADKMVSSPEVMFSYTRLVDQESGETEEVTESLLHILRRRELSFTEWEEVIRYCRQNSIEFFSTATNEDELAFLAGNKVHSVKICSGDVNYFHFIRQAARYGFSIQLDTGSSTLGEVEAAVDVIEKEGYKDIILNHCPSGYPARLEGVNLQVIPTLHRMFPYPVAFSDHSPGYDMDIAAVSLGANMIEKTITLDRTIRSPEHIMSLEPSEAEGFVRKIRDLEIALGDNRRVLAEEEMQKRLTVRRSLFAAIDLSAGEKLTQENIKYSRPGDGISADMDRYLIGKCLRRNVRKDEKLMLDDFD